MKLVSIETKEENDWLTNEVVSHGRQKYLY